MMELQEKLQAVQREIERIMVHGKRLIVAIDGRCGSGKTSLAAALQEKYGYPVIHMDDFFLRPEQRTAERLATPGENVDHERFLTEVLIPLSAGKKVTYCPFSCRIMALEEPITLPRAVVTIVEGSYACHPSLREYYDLRVFLDVDGETQMSRILRRNGPEKAEEFRRRWIPLEELYFSKLNVADTCDLILK